MLFWKANFEIDSSTLKDEFSWNHQILKHKFGVRTHFGIRYIYIYRLAPGINISSKDTTNLMLMRSFLVLKCEFHKLLSIFQVFLFLVTHAQSVHNKKTQNLCLGIILFSPKKKESEPRGDKKKEEEAGTTLGF